jgi:hypothetical protein
MGNMGDVYGAKNQARPGIGVRNTSARNDANRLTRAHTRAAVAGRAYFNNALTTSSTAFKFARETLDLCSGCTLPAGKPPWISRITPKVKRGMGVA